MVAPSTGRCNGGAGKIRDPCGVYCFMTPRGCVPVVIVSTPGRLNVIVTHYVWYMHRRGAQKGGSCRANVVVTLRAALQTGCEVVFYSTAVGLT